MRTRIFSIIIVVAMIMGNVSLAYAKSAEITVAEYIQSFEDYTVQSEQNSTVVTDDENNKAIVIKRTDLSVDNFEKTAFDSAISADTVELEFLVLPRETAGEKAEGYIQLMQGASNARLNVKISCDNGDFNRYRIKVGNKEVIGKDDLYHLPKNSADDEGNFIKENFNRVKMVMKRVVVDGTVNKDLSKFYVYLNGELKGEYTFAEIGTGGIGYSEGKTIESVRLYQYRFDTGQPLDEEIYFDDIAVREKVTVDYDPAALELEFDASMSYSAEEAKLKISGVDSVYLEQSYSLRIANAENDSDIIEIATFDAEKTDEGTAKFSFDEEISVTPGWYFASLRRVVGGETVGDTKSRKIYIAAAQQLASLPGDFSSLPENEKDAENLVRYYLPCFLSEEEITELIPEEGGMLTEKATENLSFITSYFRENNVTYTQIEEVHSDFLKAKSYLEIKNAVTREDIIKTLEKGNYLTSYVENPVYKDHLEEFYTHFETKRTDKTLPLVSDEKIAGALRYSIAMTSLNAAERSGIENVVGEYNDIFLLALEKVNEENKDSLYSALYKKAYTSTDEISSDWKTAIDSIPAEPVIPPELQEEEKHPSGGSYGGGSGGGGGSFSGGMSKKDKEDTLAPKVEPTDIVPEENPNKSAEKLTDIDGHWAENEISGLCAKGYIKGFEDSTFRPENNITRAELVTILGRILPDAGKDSETEFSDVSESDWYYLSVKKAVCLGVVKGADGKFMPDDFVTREQLAVMVYRALKTDEKTESAGFYDSTEISGYAVDAVGYLYSGGIIKGYEDNSFRPQKSVTRAEAAKILYGLIDKLAEI